MAKFDADQVAAVLAIKQAIYEWGDELDVRNGESMRERDCLTKDVEYFVGGEWRSGVEAVQEFYDGRIAAQREAGAIMCMRHFITNLKVKMVDDGHAKADFLLLFFAKPGDPPFMDGCDPLATADVWMECRKGEDGGWRISRFDSTQIFIRGS
ncbi:MAG: nuclear transport factor 2 family protein [Novosphingobium sp.]|nr:nuclear transport factor 2 family protein [Novosphingobium sp.]